MPRSVTFTAGERVAAAKLESALDETYNSSGVSIPLAVVSGGTGATTASGARTALGLGTIATQDASAVAITGGTWNSGTIGGTTQATAVSTSKLNNRAAGSQQSVAFSGSDGVSNNWLRVNFRMTGTCGGPDTTAQSGVGPNKFIVQDSSSVPTGLSIQAVGGLVVSYQVQGSVTSGQEAQRTGSLTLMAVTSQLGDTEYLAMVGDGNICYANATQAGTGTWPGGTNPFPTGGTQYFRGSMFGGNDNVRLASGATYYTEVIGREIDTAIKTGASAYRRIGMLLVANGDVQATGDDCGILLSRNASAGDIGYKTGIQFSATTAGAAVRTDGTLIATPNVDYGPNAGTPTFAKGIDFASASFSTSAIATPGFTVDPDGDTTMRTAKVSSFTVAALPTGSAGMVAFASNGRKNGEGAGSGTGVLVFHDGTAWRACDTGATVAA